MSKKIPRNAICPLCNSGLRYYECCGKYIGLKGTTMRFFGDNKVVHTEFEENVFQALGHYPDEYIDRIKAINDVNYVVIDESNIGDYYAVGGFVVLKSEDDKNLEVRSRLTKLVRQYNIDYIHFTEIYGRQKVLGDKRKAFIKEYIDIVKGLNFKPFTVCMNENEIKDLIKVTSITKEQCYIVLTWLLMDRVLRFLMPKYDNIIIELWRETENITLEKRELHQENARGIINHYPFIHISMLRHYIVFSKEEILFSSLSDLIAYMTIGLYPKLQQKVPIKQLANNYYDLLNIFNRIFCDSSGMRNQEFDELLKIVEQREQYRPKH